MSKRDREGGSGKGQGSEKLKRTSRKQGLWRKRKQSAFENRNCQELAKPALEKNGGPEEERENGM